jgi:hypothetical protein
MMLIEETFFFFLLSSLSRNYRNPSHFLPELARRWKNANRSWIRLSSDSLSLWRLCWFKQFWRKFQSKCLYFTHKHLITNWIWKCLHFGFLLFHFIYTWRDLMGWQIFWFSVNFTPWSSRRGIRRDLHPKKDFLVAFVTCGKLRPLNLPAIIHKQIKLLNNEELSLPLSLAFPSQGCHKDQLSSELLPSFLPFSKQLWRFFLFPRSTRHTQLAGENMRGMKSK